MQPDLTPTPGDPLPARLRDDRTLWPAPLHHYLQAIGAEAVWIIGLEVLGYPPNWCLSGKEFVTLTTAIDRQEQRGK